MVLRSYLIVLAAGLFVSFVSFSLYTKHENSACTFQETLPAVNFPAHVWERPGDTGLAKTTVLVTGGAGFIGTHFILEMLERGGFDIVVYDNFSRGNRENVERLLKLRDHLAPSASITVVEGAVEDGTKLTATLKAHQIDLVVHFAGFAYAAESVRFPLTYYMNLAQATRVLLQAMQDTGVNKLLYSSSSATYGVIEDEICDLPIRENSPQRPISPYGEAKLMSEMEITAFAKAQNLEGKSFSYAILRYFNVAGADIHGRMGPLPIPDISQKYGRITDACFDVAEGIRPNMDVFGGDYATHDGFAMRDYIHVSDVAYSHLLLAGALFTPSPSAGWALRYNIGIGKAYSVKEVLQAAERVTGRAIPFEVFPRRRGDPPVVIGDASRLRRDLNWTPQHTDIVAILRSAWHWRQKVSS